MTEFRISVEIHAPADRVWTVMRDIERWPEWTSTVTSVERLDDGPLRSGARALIRQPKLPPARWQITELDDARRTFTWITRSPGVTVTACHSVDTHSDGCLATLSIQFSGLLARLVARLTRQLNERYLDIEAKGLKERCEKAVRQTGATG
jgi:uncharacterized membrane protein